MKIHTMPVTCDVCGGNGTGDIRTAAAAWSPHSTISHRDPRVCRSVLDARREREQSHNWRVEHYDHALKSWLDAILSGKDSERRWWQDVCWDLAQKRMAV